MDQSPIRSKKQLIVSNYYYSQAKAKSRRLLFGKQFTHVDQFSTVHSTPQAEGSIISYIQSKESALMIEIDNKVSCGMSLTRVEIDIV